MPFPIPQISMGGGEMSPKVYSRVDLQKFGSGAKRLRNHFVEAEGGATNRPGTLFIKEVKDSTHTTRLIKFEYNEEQAYALEFGDQYIRIYSNGGVVLEATQTITGATQANPVVVTINSHPYVNGDQVYISDVGGMTELNGKFYTVANKATNTFELSGVDGTGYTAYDTGGTAQRVYTVTTPYLHTELSKLKFRQSNDVMYIAHRNHAPRKLSRLGATNWTLTTISFQPSQAAPTGVTVTPIGVTGSTSYTYRVTAVDDETGEESQTASGSTSSGNATLDSTNFNRITFTGASGAGSYNVYKLKNGLYGYIGTTETTTFEDTGFSPDFNDTDPKLRTPFNGADDYPEAVSLHEQRSWWGNTTNNPLTMWSSQTGQFENMNVSSPTRATDAITMRLVTGKGNEIRHFRSFRDTLFVFTSGAVWTLGPGGDDDAITPTSKKLTVQEYLASTHVPPLTIKNSILMVAGKADQGFEVHSLGEDYASGVVGSYVGSDITVLARHLFQKHTILEWCYIERPHRLVLAVRDDGKLLCQAYLNEHQIYAWSLWETDGEFESICHVPEGQRDAAYVVIKRTINGSDVKYIERLEDREFDSIEDAFLMDSGLSYDGTDLQTISGATQANPVVITITGHPYANGETVEIEGVLGMTELNNNEYVVANKTANTFELAGVDGTAYTSYVSGGTAQKKIYTVSGLDHLEGKTVIANADGNIESELLVTNGSITLQNAFVKLIAGLSYEATFESLPLDMAVESISKRKNVKAVIARVMNTRGLLAGTDETNLDEYPSRSTELWGDPAAMLSDVIRINVPGDWERDTSLIIKSQPGLPQTLLSVVADTNAGGG